MSFTQSGRSAGGTCPTRRNHRCSPRSASSRVPLPKTIHASPTFCGLPLRTCPHVWKANSAVAPPIVSIHTRFCALSAYGTSVLTAHVTVFPFPSSTNAAQGFRHELCSFQSTKSRTGTSNDGRRHGISSPPSFPQSNRMPCARNERIFPGTGSIHSISYHMRTASSAGRSSTYASTRHEPWKTRPLYCPFPIWTGDSKRFGDFTFETQFVSSWIS